MCGFTRPQSRYRNGKDDGPSDWKRFIRNLRHKSFEIKNCGGCSRRRPYCLAGRLPAGIQMEGRRTGLNKNDASRNILTAFILNFTFVIIEAIGGILTNSIAITTDAVHDLGDCIAIGFSFFLERLSKRGADDKYTYGYRRYSLMAALVTSLILIAGSAVMIYTSVKRLAMPQAVIAPGMLFMAVLGVIVNGAAVLKTRKGKGANERAISLHMLEDVLGWAAVLVGSLLIWLTNEPIIDPILSIAISIFILAGTVKNISGVISVLLEKVPRDFNMPLYREAVGRTEGVLGLHHIHVWSLDGENRMATLHAVVRENLSDEDRARVRRSIAEASRSFGIEHITVQLEAGNVCEEGECDPNGFSEHSSAHHHAH
jgi:cobalt-zinc-cadmium efflux system protein